MQLLTNGPWIRGIGNCISRFVGILLVCWRIWLFWIQNCILQNCLMFQKFLNFVLLIN